MSSPGHLDTPTDRQRRDQRALDGPQPDENRPDRGYVTVMDDSSGAVRRAVCPTCGCKVGQRHADGCDQGRCEHDGLAWLDCQYERNFEHEQLWDELDAEQVRGEDVPHRPDLYVGLWAMERDARQLGWYVRWDTERREFVRCSPTEPGSGPDLTRLVEDGRWDWRNQMWIRPKAVLYVRCDTRHEVDAELARLWSWAAELGYEVIAQRFDVARMGRGFAETLKMFDPRSAVEKQNAMPYEPLAEAVLIVDQQQLGASNKVRRRAVERIRTVGGNLRSLALWDDGAPPASYAEQARVRAAGLVGPKVSA
jgi:hypothetical protein